MQQESSPEATDEEMEHMVVVNDSIERLPVQQPSACADKKRNCSKVKSAQ